MKTLSPISHLPSSAPAFRVSLDQSRQVSVLPLPGRECRAEGEQTSSKTKKPLLIKRGSTTVKIYGRGPYTIAWRDAAGAGRQRAVRAALADAKAFAEEKATSLANGETWKSQMGANDFASYQRARELLTQIGSPPLEVAVGIYTESVQMLPEGMTLPEAIKFVRDNRPAGLVTRNIPGLVEDLLASKRKTGKGEKWLGTLEQQLARFAKHHTGPLTSLRSAEINGWLDKLSVGLRTRKNYRAAINELIRYAQSHGHLSKAWDEMSHVENPDLPAVEVEVYTREQITKLLAVTRPSMIPFTVLAAFAGIRHEEMAGTKALLDWRDINLDRGVIRIKKTVGKTKKMRLIEMHKNLIEWLRPYAKISGPVCELTQTANALCDAKQRAGIPSKRGELTNALRASFISYRLAETNDIGLVAREAGNSPQIIHQHYLELVSKAEADRWFQVWPTQAEVLQLNFRL